MLPAEPYLSALPWLYTVHDIVQHIDSCLSAPTCLQEVAETMEKQNLKEESIEFYNQVG